MCDCALFDIGEKLPRRQSAPGKLDLRLLEVVQGMAAQMNGMFEAERLGLIRHERH